MNFFTLFAILFVLISITDALDLDVGGKDGWVQHPKESYDHWAGRLRFQINDRLVFKYNKTEDSVLVVNKQDYSSCNVNNPFQKLEGGNSVFQFNRSGPFYFISGVADRCGKNQKLIVVVLADRKKKPITPPPSPSMPSTPPPSPSPLMPSTPPPSPSPSMPSTPPPSPSPSPSMPSTPPPSPSPSPLMPSTPPPSPSPSMPSTPPPSPSPSPLMPSTPPPSPSPLMPSTPPPSPSPLMPSTPPSSKSPSSDQGGGSTTPTAGPPPSGASGASMLNIWKVGMVMVAFVFGLVVVG